jgi:hypothetical protein
MNDQTTIHVSDPIFREEVRVTRGNGTIYLVKYEDDTRYMVLDQHGDDTGFTWRGGIDGASDFIAIGDMIDDIKAVA